MSEFCVIDLGGPPTHVGCVASAKRAAEKTDRGYRVGTCNSSSLDKSISDTNSITGSDTFSPGFFVFQPRRNLRCGLCTSVRVCARQGIHVRRGDSAGGDCWGLNLTAEVGLAEPDWTIFIYNRAEENSFVPDDIFID